jgi:hypothetical protein
MAEDKNNHIRPQEGARNQEHMKTLNIGLPRDSMSYEPIKKLVFPCINHPQILMVCMYIGRKLVFQTKIL